MAKHTKTKLWREWQIEFGFLTLKMADGTICYLELSWAETEFHSSYELAGDKGMITFDHEESSPVNWTFASKMINHLVWNSLKSVMDKDPYYRQLEHFIQCLLGKEEPIVTAEEAAKGN